MYCQLHFVGGLDEAVRQQLCSSTNTSMTAPFYGERTTKVGALGKNSAGKCVFELSNGMFYRQTGQTGAKKTYLDYFRWHYSIYMVKIQISCYLIYLFAWIKPVAENGWTEKINSVCLNLVFWSIFSHGHNFSGIPAFWWRRLAIWSLIRQTRRDWGPLRVTGSGELQLGMAQNELRQNLVAEIARAGCFQHLIMFKDVESHFQSYFVHFGFWDRRTAWTTSPWGLSWWWSTETDESSIVAWVSNCFNDFTNSLKSTLMSQLWAFWKFFPTWPGWPWPCIRMYYIYIECISYT